MKKLARHIVSGAQAALVLVTIAALMVSIVSSAQRHSVLDNKLADQMPKSSHAQLMQGPPAPEDISKEMATDRRPHTEQSAHTWQSVSFSKSNGDDHLKLSKTSSTALASFLRGQSRFKTAVTSTSLISSELGSRFTLVGARPDGTS